MTKRDYEAIARCLAATDSHHSAYPDFHQGWHAAVASIRYRLAEVLESDNPRFNRELFMSKSRGSDCS